MTWGFRNEPFTSITPTSEAILALVIQEEIREQKCEMQKLEELAENPIEEAMYATVQMQETLADMNPTLLYDLKNTIPTPGSFSRTTSMSTLSGTSATIC